MAGEALARRGVPTPADSLLAPARGAGTPPPPPPGPGSSPRSAASTGQRQGGGRAEEAAAARLSRPPPFPPLPQPDASEEGPEPFWARARPLPLPQAAPGVWEPEACVGINNQSPRSGARGDSACPPGVPGVRLSLAPLLPSPGRLVCTSGQGANAAEGPLARRVPPPRLSSYGARPPSPRRRPSNLHPRTRHGRRAPVLRTANPAGGSAPRRPGPSTPRRGPGPGRPSARGPARAAAGSRAMTQQLSGRLPSSLPSPGRPGLQTDRLHAEAWPQTQPGRGRGVGQARELGAAGLRQTRGSHGPAFRKVTGPRRPRRSLPPHESPGRPLLLSNLEK